ncbi:MAG: phosphate acyltransferase PlsX [Clostridiales bacterium]|nr:phosphate acyltransferase PlsX [Clostridiales bacterium]
MKIVVDIGACDNPEEVVRGCALSLQEDSSTNLIISGDENFINKVLSEYNVDRNRLEIIDAKEVISNEDVPTVAIRRKTESSLVKAIDALKSDDVMGMVSAGSTGAVLSGGIFRLGRIKGIHRPALAPILPTLIDGKEVCLIDCGANVDCRPEYLVEFAMMGVSYMKTVHGVQNPRVGLVCNGVEDKKGNELSKEVFARLKALPINFVGNMEAREALSGDYDVLVCDGFVGNVLLKTVEGTAKMVMKLLKTSIMESASAKFGALFMKKAFDKIKNKMDYQKKGGAPLLGVEKIIVKSHGASNASAIMASINQVKKMYEGNLIQNIKDGIATIAAVEENNDANS